MTDDDLRCPKCGAWPRPGVELIEVEGRTCVCLVCAHVWQREPARQQPVRSDPIEVIGHNGHRRP